MGTGCSSLDDFIKKYFYGAVLHKNGATWVFVLDVHGGTAHLSVDSLTCNIINDSG